MARVNLPEVALIQFFRTSAGVGDRPLKDNLTQLCVQAVDGFFTSPPGAIVFTKVWRACVPRRAPPDLLGGACVTYHTTLRDASQTMVV
jgi:hypothetical protein